jgi:hypothetical protein
MASVPIIQEVRPPIRLHPQIIIPEEVITRLQATTETAILRQVVAVVTLRPAVAAAVILHQAVLHQAGAVAAAVPLQAAVPEGQEAQAAGAAPDVNYIVILI